MKLFDAFFSFEGRLSRSGFFTLMGIICLLLVCLAGLGIMLLFAEAAIGVPYGLLLLGLASLTGLWSVAALLTRRLHDMNLSAAHAMFVYGLNLFALGFAIYNPSIGVALTVFMLGASIWFLLTPGSAGRNRYGRPTSARRAAAPSFGQGLRAG